MADPNGNYLADQVFLFQGKIKCLVTDRMAGVWFWRSINGSEVGQGHSIEFSVYTPENAPVGDESGGEVIPFPARTPEPVQALPVSEVEPLTIDVSVSSSTEVKPTVFINSCDAAGLAKAIVGIGKGYATRIIARKPEGGYQNWDHLISVNEDLHVKWETIRAESESLIGF